MKSLILVLLILTTPAPTHAGWFSKDSDKSVLNSEREQRLQAEKEAQEKQRQIDAQQQTIMQLHTTTCVIAGVGFALLIVGVGLGSKAKRDGNQT